MIGPRGHPLPAQLEPSLFGADIDQPSTKIYRAVIRNTELVALDQFAAATLTWWSAWLCHPTRTEFPRATSRARKLTRSVEVDLLPVQGAEQADLRARESSSAKTGLLIAYAASLLCRGELAPSSHFHRRKLPKKAPLRCCLSLPFCFPCF